jgi:hypothetical protein
MRRRASTFFTACAGVLAGVIVTATLPVFAASVGDAFRLGQTNSIGAGTRLQGSPGTNLTIDNNKANGMPLNLISEPGRPPLRVNREAKVANLNVDELDGHSSGFFASRNDFGVNFDRVLDLTSSGANNAILESGITAPKPGVLLVAGGVEIVDGGTTGVVACALQVGGLEIIGSDRHYRTVDNENAACETNGAVAVAPGNHIVRLAISGSGFDAEDATLQVTFVSAAAGGTGP